MDIQITNDASEVLFREQQDFPVGKLLSASLIEEKQDMKYKFLDASFKEIFFDGYHISYGRAHIYENIHIATLENEVSNVSLFFLLKGQFETMFDGTAGARRRYKSLEHNLYYNPDGAENTDVEKQDGAELISLSFSKERFLELAANGGRVLDVLADKVAGGKGLYLNRKTNAPITTRMLMILDEVRQCQFNGGVKKLFLQSKMLELLALQCEQYERGEKSGPEVIRLSAVDKEKIFHARELLLRNIQHPPSLRELSRQAELNEFKLKNGFRQLFDNTVFGYLNDHRMEYARKLILQQQHSLTSIAEQMGFSSLQHFSNAFRKKFGVCPSKIK
jgi:AraC-like DNA-binding protein